MQSKLIWEYQRTDCIHSAADAKELLLANRSLNSSADFLTPPEPLQLSPQDVGLDQKKLIKAAKIISTAVANKQKILLFGDYDVDGVCATAIMWEAIRELGALAQPFIPHRLKHGYGLSIKALEEIWASNKPDLVITVDNGIVAHAALAWLAEHHVPVILTDHHQPDGKKIEAEVLIHSTQVCGAAVAWFLAREIAPTAAAAQLDLLGLATLADQMPLIGSNRAFALYGLQALDKTTRAGLLALKKVAQINGPITSQAAQFGLIPRLNAMGRLEHGLISLRLVCVRDRDRAAQLADQLQSTNTDRQQLTYDLQAAALTQAEQQQAEKIIIVQSENFHEGVIGLLAGKLLETVYKPVIALQIGSKTAKASVRSVPGFDIIQFLRNQQLPFLELGGHALAAGFLVATETVPEVVAGLHAAARQAISDELLIPRLRLEAKLAISALSIELVEVINLFQPFGQANPVPVFGIESLELRDVMTLGSNQQHLKLVLADESGKSVTGLFWKRGELLSELQVGKQYSVAAKLELNEWRGKQRVQLIISDLKALD